MDNLRLIVMENIKDLGEKVNSHLKNMLGTTKDLIVPIDEVRFNNGEGKAVIKETIRDKDLYILSDVSNYDVFYNYFVFVFHFVDLFHIF